MTEPRRPRPGSRAAIDEFLEAVAAYEAEYGPLPEKPKSTDPEADRTARPAA